MAVPFFFAGDEMHLEDFSQKYKDRLDLFSISWGDFPEKLQEAGLRFKNDWIQDLPTRHLRELSGFDDMSVKDLLAYADADLSEKETTSRSF